MSPEFMPNSIYKYRDLIISYLMSQINTGGRIGACSTYAEYNSPGSPYVTIKSKLLTVDTEQYRPQLGSSVTAKHCGEYEANHAQKWRFCLI